MVVLLCLVVKGWLIVMIEIFLGVEVCNKGGGGGDVGQGGEEIDGNEDGCVEDVEVDFDGCKYEGDCGQVD